jgi:hypothetical protein
MGAVSQALNVRLSEDMLSRVERIRQRLSMQVPGATRTDAVRMVIQRGLETLESDTEGRTPEDLAWMGADLSRLGEFEPYDFGGVDPDELGTPVRHLPNGAFVVEAGR